MNTIETFYTGGGITLAEIDLNKDEYAVVSSDAPEYLTIYKRSEDNEKSYLPDDMLFSTTKENLTPKLKPLYLKMINKLNREA